MDATSNTCGNAAQDCAQASNAVTPDAKSSHWIVEHIFPWRLDDLDFENV